MFFKRFYRFLLITVLWTPLQGLTQTIIINSKNPNTEISQNTLRAIYTMKMRTWENGTPITVFILAPDSDTHREFCLKSLGVFPYQIQRKWDVMVFSGTGQSPVVVADDSEMLKKIGETPGAIGYVRNKEASEDVRPVLVR